MQTAVILARAVAAHSKHVNAIEKQAAPPKALAGLAQKALNVLKPNSAKKMLGYGLGGYMAGDAAFSDPKAYWDSTRGQGAALAVKDHLKPEMLEKAVGTPNAINQMSNYALRPGALARSLYRGNPGSYKAPLQTRLEDIEPAKGTTEGPFGNVEQFKTTGQRSVTSRPNSFGELARLGGLEKQKSEVAKYSPEVLLERAQQGLSSGQSAGVKNYGTLTQQNAAENAARAGDPFRNPLKTDKAPNYRDVDKARAALQKVQDRQGQSETQNPWDSLPGTHPWDLQQPQPQPQPRPQHSWGDQTDEADQGPVDTRTPGEIARQLREIRLRQYGAY